VLQKCIFFAAFVSENCSILVRLKNCTTEEEQNVSNLLVNGVRNLLVSSDHGIDVETLGKVEVAVREAFRNIKHGKLLSTSTCLDF